MSGRRCLILAASLVLAAPTWAAKQITIIEAALHQYEDGPVMPPSHQFFQGETVNFSCRFGDYSASEEDRPHILLSWEIDALDPQGVKLVPTKVGTVDAHLSPQDKEWMPKVRYEFLLPPLAGSGDYKLTIRVKDELGGTTASKEIPFQVKGIDIEPSDTLVVRNYRWFRGESDMNAISTAAYRPGDTVWARFDITGYKLGDGNQFDVAYGLEVFRASGSSLYAVPVAAEMNESSFYPKRVMPGALSLNLTPDLAKGDYTIVLHVEDRLGSQNFESKYVFHVE